MSTGVVTQATVEARRARDVTYTTSESIDSGKFFIAVCGVLRYATLSQNF
jgi:hypothetical protein